MTDEATLLWVAAVVEEVEPEALLPRVDLGALTRVVDDAAAAGDPAAQAAALLAAVIRRRPFPEANAAIGWLAATEALARSGCRVTARPAQVVRLCDAIRHGALDPADVVTALRRWVVEAGIECPACGRKVFGLDAAARRLTMPGTSRFELTARCAFEHRAHDRRGRPTSPVRPAPPEQGAPVLARGACGSLLVATAAGSLVVSPSCDDPPLVRVVEVDEVRSGDLVGRWDALVHRSTTVGFVPADEVRIDADDRLDLGRLRRALRTPDLCGAATR